MSPSASHGRLDRTDDRRQALVVFVRVEQFLGASSSLVEVFLSSEFRQFHTVWYPPLSRANDRAPELNSGLLYGAT